MLKSERKVTQRAKREQACSIFPKNTVYLVGIGGTIGKVGFCENEASCNQQINAITPCPDKLFHRYLSYFIQATQIQIMRQANLSTLPIINQDRTGALFITVPPINEQIKIVSTIEHNFEPINEAIKVSEDRITLLQERKQIIINDVITGKVKVI